MWARAEWLGIFADAARPTADSALGLGPYAELLDLPLWALAAVFAFRISTSFRGGTLGRAALWVGWALAVVASGKVGRGAVLILDNGHLLSSELGQLAWALVVATAWVLAGLGIYEFYRAGRSI